MWCDYIDDECDNLNNCLECISYKSYWQRVTPATQFNHECPDCHGKFNQPTHKQIFMFDGQIITTPYFTSVCPFCGREMKGL